MSRDLAIARIHRQPRSAMQSGKARNGQWMLVFAPAEARRQDPLTGWYGSGDTRAQLRISFASQEAAEAYARANNIPYEVEPPRPEAALKPKSYAENFRYGRAENWTH
ncbi:ETC complex I subunit [Pseudoroseomonas cervicalis]|uniref:ETC complex I subunit conserved region n=1 Tax=Pseudoroseomonas cervicalis ATCC 49957 TaxID=525371 RepID=D5RQ29_9PROT|nr:ETC complex I subunit [Pseudoroseomonas cervicalis]EFH10591.1 ETC complex I subunit conserved region [Pseudoroseomonas cervicalis ATCC 49957]WBV41509.1 ETC complex I subunit [Pseudoroseomonas cervicalis]